MTTDSRTPPDADDDRTVIRPTTMPQARAANPLSATQIVNPPPPGGVHAPTVMGASGTPRGPVVASSDGNALPVGTIMGEFEIQQVLGEGGFGIVYVAWDRSLESKVALKEYMPSSLAARDGTTVKVRSSRHQDTFDAGLKSFINEARLLRQFDHPSLVKVYRFWEAQGTAYMVMPLYEGVTLKDKLKAMGHAPDEAWLMDLLAPLTEALAVIHGKQVYHRDIAPDNIMLLAENGKPLLLDFGAARRVIGDMTQALTVILKPGYAPFEQYAEDPSMQQGSWTDIYALAGTIHFAIMGRTPPASVSRIVSDSYVPLTQAARGRYSEGFLQALDNALVVRPKDRTQTVAELRMDLGLETYAARTQITRMGGDTAAASGPRSTFGGDAGGSTPKADAASGGRKGWIAGVAVAALLAAGGAAWLGSRPKAPEPAPATAANPPPAVTSPAPSPTTPTVTAPAVFDVRTEFDKVLAGQTPGFDVEARAQKSQLRIGQDQLSFTVKSTRDGYVHVLVLDPNGELMLMFPNSQASDNRIRAGQTLTLPQKEWLLDTAEPAGPEHLLVVVSKEPRDYSELGRGKEWIFLKLPTGAQGTEALSRWTRSTPLLLGGLKSCPSADCENYGAARLTVEVVR